MRSLSEFHPQNFWKGLPFDPSCMWRLCRAQTHRTITDIMKCIPTNAPTEVPGHACLREAVTEETYQPPENIATVSKYTRNQGVLVLLLTQ